MSEENEKPKTPADRLYANNSFATELRDLEPTDAFTSKDVLKLGMLGILLEFQSIRMYLSDIVVALQRITGRLP